MQYIVKSENETLEQIVYNHYGDSFEYLEIVLKENTNLYMQESIYLNKDLIINLPEIKKEAQKRVSLWN